ncbi:MAG: response regulator [Anaerolineaceae bacterium]|jgi:CheY-like chemotaxis protein|nr:response regulator [Anaerolineaceae bacterium]
MAKILIAEDEQDIRTLIVFTLQFAGHEVVAYKDGQEALENAEQDSPDLIMMDVRMPRMDGYTACRNMKTIPAIANIPVVFLSAKGQEAEINIGYEAGAEEYLLKPFAPDDLTHRVNELLQKFGK